MFDVSPTEYIFWLINYVFGISLYMLPFLLMIEWFGFTSNWIAMSFIAAMPFYLFILLTAIDDAMDEQAEKLKEAEENLNE